MPMLLLSVDPTRDGIVHDMLDHVAAIPSTADGESSRCERSCNTICYPTNPELDPM